MCVEVSLNVQLGYFNAEEPTSIAGSFLFALRSVLRILGDELVGL